MGADLKAEVAGSAYEAARAVLIDQPELARQDAELLSALGLRLDAANVLDFGPAALARVHAAHQAEATAREEIELIARENFAAQAQAQAAVLELIAATDAADLADRLDAVARERFGLAAGVLALEADEAAPAGWFRLVDGQVDMILGGEDTRLGLVRNARGLFGEAGEAVEAVALVRITLGGRDGVLAFGAGEPEGFSADMSDDLVRFLARVVEGAAARWTAN